MPTVTCPACGDADALRGRPVPDGVRVDCGACGHSWERDLTPTCTLCGSTNLEVVPTATLEEAGRGEQRTPSGIRDVHRCLDCGARDATWSSPVVEPEEERGPSLRVTRARDPEDDEPTDTARPASTRRVESPFGAFALGQVIGGQWRLEELVRWSRSGSLWRAVAVDGDDRQVLFKLVHPRLTRDDQRTALHAAAAGAARGVRHANVLPVLDVKAVDHHVLVVAGWVPGTVLDASSRLEPERLVAVGAGLADGLAALHAQGVVHLDLRPDKVLVDERGTARIVDLGSGRTGAGLRTRASGDDARQLFRAPEQLLTHDRSPPADVYGLGLVLWTLAGGNMRRLGDDAAAQVRRRMTDDVPPLEPSISQLPQRVIDAIAGATLRAPARRPTAAQLAQLLRG